VTKRILFRKDDEVSISWFFQQINDFVGHQQLTHILLGTRQLTYNLLITKKHAPILSCTSSFAPGSRLLFCWGPGSGFSFSRIPEVLHHAAGSYLLGTRQLTLILLGTKQQGIQLYIGPKQTYI